MLNRTHPVLKVWTLVNAIICIFSSFQYAFQTAFGEPQKGTFYYILDVIFEWVFISDSLLQFFVGYQDEKTKMEVRNILKIAKNYLKERAFFDFITCV